MRSFVGSEAGTGQVALQPMRAREKHKRLTTTAVRTVSLIGAVCAAALVLAPVSNLHSETELPARVDQLLTQFNDPRGRVFVVAHRGCWGERVPENSLAAISRCIEIGVDMVEIDVAVTRDGVPILMHDETLDRTTGIRGSLHEFDWAQLREARLRAGSGGMGEPLTDETIPLLKDALVLARDKILINLDIKGSAFDQAFEAALAADVSHQIVMKMAAAPDSPELTNASFRGKTLFMPIIRECTARNLENNCTPRLSTYVPNYAPYQPVAYEITYSTENFFTEGVPSIRAMGSRVWVNTLSPYQAAGAIDEDAIRDPAGTWGRIIDLGGNIIQTDYPEALIRYLETVND